MINVRNLKYSSEYLPHYTFNLEDSVGVSPEATIHAIRNKDGLLGFALFNERKVELAYVMVNGLTSGLQLWIFEERFSDEEALALSFFYKFFYESCALSYAPTINRKIFEVYAQTNTPLSIPMLNPLFIQVWQNAFNENTTKLFK